MAELVNNDATAPDDLSLAASRQLRGQGAADAAEETGWNWRKGLTQPLPHYPPIVARTRSGAVPLSFGQQRLWFLAQLQAGSAAYNVPLAWRLTGVLDLPALQRGLGELIARHEALRTIFPAETGEPWQVIAAPHPFSLDEVDLRGAALSQRESELDRRLLEETKRPFDLASGPVLRAVLFRLAQEEHVFLLVLHHIVCDGPSIAILLEELAHLYRGFATGQTVPLPKPPVQYADFAIWQREALIDEIRGPQLAYWREQLRDCPAALDFPTNQPRPAGGGFRGGTQYRNLSRQLSEDLRLLARRQGVTRFMALLALFQVLLARYTGQEEVSVGCPMTHRIRAEVARVVGFFANMMVLRSRLEGNPSCREVLRRTREVALGAYAHQDLPFEELVAELQPERVPGRNPYFQAMLVVEEAAWRDLNLAGLQTRPVPVHNGTAKFDFSLYAIDHPEGFRLSLEYNCDLSDTETVSRLLEHYENLLQAAVADPDRRVLDLPLLSPAEREHILRKWNDTREDYSGAASVPRLIEEQAELAPDAIALTFLNQSLTYRELNARANRLARYLAEKGAGAEVLVAIAVSRSLELVIALLAVMKTGAAYLPLDLSHPRERRESILRDSGARILISDQAQEASPICSNLILEDERIHIDRQDDANLSIEISPNDRAYVIYTSGSTGQPKGVEVEHANLTNFLATMRKRPGFSNDDVLLAVTTMAFDIAGLELWLPLTTGASLILASREETVDPRRLIDILEKSKVSVMQATPSIWQMLLAAGWSGSPHLKVLCGGEALSGSLANDLVPRGASTWNMYGPTETTIWSSSHQVSISEAIVTPIGQPIGNTTMYVLDANMQPIPVGVRGELFIGGAGVARGYLGKPELTAQKFMPDPFSSEAGARIYRTGDSVRQRPDGTLEFLGRMDRQVKIRGYRIEPAEIEAVLHHYPGLQRAAVVVRDYLDEKRLIAYLVLSGVGSNGYFNPAEVKGLLREKLPDYMIPSAFVVIDALPMTSSGKLDWKALPAPDQTSFEKPSVAPRDQIERLLARTWEDVLQIHPVGVTDSFFELGGHSLMATRLFARIEKVFGRHLPVGTLFEAPTIEKLAAILRHQSSVSKTLIQVQPGVQSKPPIFFVQARVGYHAVAAALGPDQPVYVIPTDDLFLQDTERSLNDLTTDLTQRLRRQQPHGPYYLGGWCLAGRVAFAIASELRRQGEEVGLLAIIDMPAPRLARLSRGAGLRNFAARLGWHARYLKHSKREQRREWITGAFRGLSWHARYRAWKCAHFFFRRLGRPLPESLRHPTRLLAEVTRKDTTVSYPGRITLFRPSERAFDRYDSEDLGWGQIAAGGVDVHEIAGLKRTLLRANATEVGRRLKNCLSQSTGLAQTHQTQ